MKLKLIAAAILISTPALAQQQPEFVPFTVERGDFERILDHVRKSAAPWDFSNPLIMMLSEMEQRAIQKRDAEKKAPPPPGPGNEPTRPVVPVKP